MKISNSIIFVLFFSLGSFGQSFRKKNVKIQKIGILYNTSENDNYLFNNIDFSYRAATFKLQLFYNLTNWKSLNFQLTMQPQYQVIQHQLINEQFVLPSEENYQEKRATYTAPKTMRLFGFELGLIAKKRILKKLDIEIAIGLGVASINTTTERLAKGFTFMENASFGFSYNMVRKIYVYFGANVGHVSNFDTKSPNIGYSFNGFEAGISFELK
jgi:hypothetical protein